jgi:hypothetical protein
MLAEERQRKFLNEQFALQGERDEAGRTAAREAAALEAAIDNPNIPFEDILRAFEDPASGAAPLQSFLQQQADAVAAADLRDEETKRLRELTGMYLNEDTRPEVVALANQGDTVAKQVVDNLARKGIQSSVGELSQFPQDDPANRQAFQAAAAGLGGSNIPQQVLPIEAVPREQSTFDEARDRRAGTLAAEEAVGVGDFAPDVGGAGKVTEGQARKGQIATTALNANQLLLQLERQGGLGGFAQGIGSLPLGNIILGTMGRGDIQRYNQASRQYITMVFDLSGANIPEGEKGDFIARWFVQPGDTPETIKQKQVDRNVSLAAAIAASQGGFVIDPRLPADALMRFVDPTSMGGEIGDVGAAQQRNFGAAEGLGILPQGTGAQTSTGVRYRVIPDRVGRQR